MKKALLLLALPLLFVAACDSNNNTNSGTTPKQDPTPAADPEPATPAATTTYMTTIEEGKAYIDINFTEAIPGFKIKFGTTEITETTKIDFVKDTEFTVEGTPAKKYYAYFALEKDGSWTGSKSLAVDAERYIGYVQSKLNVYAKTRSDYRVYVCLTDTEQGWSKTIPGVDEVFGKLS